MVGWLLHVIRTLGTQPVTWHGEIPAPLPFATLKRDPKTLLAPEPLSALAADQPAVLEQTLVSLAISPARPVARERPQRRPQCHIICDHNHDVTLSEATLPRQPARPTLKEPKPILQSQERHSTSGPGSGISRRPLPSAPEYQAPGSPTIRLSF